MMSSQYVGREENSVAFCSEVLNLKFFIKISSLIMDRWLKDGILRKKISSSCTLTAAETETGNTDIVSVMDQPDDAQSLSGAQEKHDLPMMQPKPKNFLKLSSSSNGSKKRKYAEGYLSLGFSHVGNADAPDAQCILCHKILSNSSLVPAKLRRHLETNHPEFKDREITFFMRKLDSLMSCKLSMIKIAKTDNENATEASYTVSYRIALAGEAHTIIIAETLIKPCAKDMAICMLDEKSADIYETVLLSNNTVERRIQDLATDIETELVSRLHSCDAYSIQLDESTDVSGLAVLLVFVRYSFDTTVEEDLLLCECLESNTTGERIFLCIDNYMKTHGINWEKCVDVCTDRAQAMVGKVNGTVT